MSGDLEHGFPPEIREPATDIINLLPVQPTTNFPFGGARAGRLFLPFAVILIGLHGPGQQAVRSRAHAGATKTVSLSPLVCPPCGCLAPKPNNMIYSRVHFVYQIPSQYWLNINTRNIINPRAQYRFGWLYYGTAQQPVYSYGTFFLPALHEYMKIEHNLIY